MGRKRKTASHRGETALSSPQSFSKGYGKDAAKYLPHAPAQEALSELTDVVGELHALETQLRSVLESHATTPDGALPHSVSLLVSPPCGIVVTDTEGVIRQASRSSAALLHVSPAYLQGKELMRFFELGGRLRLTSILKHSTTGAGIDRFNAVLQPKRGGAVPVEVTAVSDGIAGKAGSFCWLVRPVAEPPRAGALPDDSNLLFEKVFSNVHIGIACMDTSFNFIRVNKAYAAADNCEPEFFPGRNHFDLYPNKENEAIFRQVVATGEPFIAREKAFTYAEHPEWGTSYWEWSLMPLKGASGAVTSLVLSTRDVTERHNARLALEESERKYRLLLEEAADGIITCDVRGRILEANSKACDMTGYRSSEVTGRNIRDLLPPRGSRRRIGRMGCAASGKSATHERRLLRKDGAVIIVEANARRLEGGALRAVIRDVTERKRAEEEMLLYQQRLKLVTSRLALAEEGERRRIAKDIHDQVGQVLALCQMKLGALVEEAAGTPTAETLRDIRSQISWVIKYTRSLTFELGSPILYELGLEAALEELIEGLSGQHGFVGSFEDDGQAKPLSADMRIVLFQAAREVLTNAVKHARARNVKLKIAVQGSDVAILVEDDGVGFDVAEAASRVRRGGGFGIFSTRERLEYIGGSLDIDSRPGHGTRVSIRTPLLKH